MSIEAATERLLDYLSFGEDHQDLPWGADADWDRSQADFCKLPLSYFNEMEVFPVAAELQNLTKTYQRRFYDPGEIRPGDLPRSWTSKMLVFPKDDFAPVLGEQPLYFCVSYRDVPLSEVRGKFKVLGAVVESAQAALLRGGRYTSQRLYVQHVGKGKWVAAGQPTALYPEPLGDEECRHLQMGMSLAFTQDYDWRIILGFGKSMPTISLATDPIGSREIFRLRDLPSGKSRRSALRHWVNSHYRQVRADPVEERKIWAHLRGSEEFVWNGMYCKICPSPYDLRKAAEYQKESLLCKNRDRAKR